VHLVQLFHHLHLPRQHRRATSAPPTSPPVSPCRKPQAKEQRCKYAVLPSTASSLEREPTLSSARLRSCSRTAVRPRLFPTHHRDSTSPSAKRTWHPAPTHAGASPRTRAHPAVAPRPTMHTTPCPVNHRSAEATLADITAEEGEEGLLHPAYLRTMRAVRSPRRKPGPTARPRHLASSRFSLKSPRKAA